MPEAYSMDLRERVLRACRRHDGSRHAIARRFQVGESTLYEWQRAEREDGRRAAKPHRGGPAPIVDLEGEQVLRALVAEDTDATLAEYARGFAERTGKTISTPVVCQALKRLNLRRKKRRSGPASGIGRTLPRNAKNGRKA